MAVIEGPIVAVVCGFLITLKILNPLLVYIILVIGDVVGDGIIYYVGYSGKRFLHYFKINEEKLERAKTYFHENHKKAIITSKLVHGIGFTGLLAAGASHVPYKRYFKTCTFISVVQSAVMMMVGVLFGHAYVQIGKYLDYYAATVSVAVLVILLFILIKRYKLGTKTSL